MKSAVSFACGSVSPLLLIVAAVAVVSCCMAAWNSVVMVDRQGTPLGLYHSAVMFTVDESGRVISHEPTSKR